MPTCEQCGACWPEGSGHECGENTGMTWAPARVRAAAKTVMDAAPDYTAMDLLTLLDAVQDDAAKWARAFRQTALKLGYADLDEGWLIGWFASAIENSDSVRRWRMLNQTQPVGGAAPPIPARALRFSAP